MVNFDSLKKLYNDSNYEEAIAQAKTIYNDEEESLDFRLASLGYCIESLNKLGKDTTECQEIADNLLEGTEGDYRNYLMDSLNIAKEEQ
jgi:hypothetical protein